MLRRLLLCGLLGIGGCLCGCTGLLIDKETMGLLKEVVASGKVDAEDPEIIIEFYNAYGMRVAVENTNISAKVEGKTGSDE